MRSRFARPANFDTLSLSRILSGNFAHKPANLVTNYDFRALSKAAT
jgi:hypothetical protein